MSEFKPGTKVHVEFDGVVERPEEYEYIKPDHGVRNAHSTPDYDYGFLTNELDDFKALNPRLVRRRGGDA